MMDNNYEKCKYYAVISSDLEYENLVVEVYRSSRMTAVISKDSDRTELEVSEWRCLSILRPQHDLDEFLKCIQMAREMLEY